MSDDERDARIMYEVISEQTLGQPSWWWLSFCDPGKPKGEKFLGVAIVQANGFALAITETHLRGINPGGEVAFQEIPPEVGHDEFASFCNRLLTRGEAEAVLVATGGA